MFIQKKKRKVSRYFTYHAKIKHYKKTTEKKNTCLSMNSISHDKLFPGENT